MRDIKFRGIKKETKEMAFMADISVTHEED
jgi:hypothetical protein